MDNDIPIRPSPMKPHVAKLLLLEEKHLLLDGLNDTGSVPLPSMHSREGEKRIDTAALIVCTTYVWE